MMRSSFALLLLALMVFQPTVAVAQDGSVQVRPRDESDPAGRHPTISTTEPFRGETAREETETARVRARVRSRPPGTKVEVSLRGGGQVEGELVEADSNAFALWVEQDSGAPRVRKTLEYAEVTSIVLPDWKGWRAIDRLGEIDTGHKVEMLLVDETRVEGRLFSVTAEGLVLQLGNGRTRVLSIDEVASFRKQGMHPATKVVVAVGAVVGSLLLATLIALANYPG